MTTIETMRLRIKGTEKIENILQAENSSLLDYNFFENVLLENFRHDHKEGGAFLCAVIDDSKEIFPYKEINGKQANPLKNVVRGLTVRFNSVYSESLGCKFRLSTHKTRATTLVPISAKKTGLSKEERALLVVRALLSESQANDLDHMIVARKEELETARIFEQELRGSVLEISIAEKGAYRWNDAISIASERNLLTKGTTEKATEKNSAIIEAIAAGMS